MKAIGSANLRRALLVATWFAGTGLATFIVYEAVGAVALQVTDQRPEPISQAGVDKALAQPSPKAASPSAPASAPSPTASPITSQPTQPPSQPPAAGGGGGAGSAPPPPATVPSNSHTFALVGGTASLSCTGGQISLSWATPNSGFSVETGSSDGGSQIEVRFRSDTHDSRLQSWCSGGVVQGTIEEQSS